MRGSGRLINHTEPSRQWAKSQFDIKGKNKPVKVSEKCLEIFLNYSEDKLTPRDGMKYVMEQSRHQGERHNRDLLVAGEISLK